MRRLLRLRGTTLIEIAVAMAILGLIVSAVVSGMLPMQRVSKHVASAVDMESTATRVLRQLSRELQNSGWDGTTDKVLLPLSPGTLTELSANPNPILRFSTLQTDWSWSGDIAYSLVADGTFSGVTGNPTRYRLERTQAGATVRVCSGISAMSVTRAAGDDTVLIEITFLRADEYWTGSTPPPPLQRKVRERIGLRNTSSS